MTNPDQIKLLFGPYRPPLVRRGDRTHCLFRDCDVIVTSWSYARIPWPRCRALGTHGGGSGLLVDEELARAVRHESAAAVCFWWGVTAGVVWRWRQALGVSRKENEGSQRLIRAAAKAGAEAMRRRGWTEEEREQCSRHNIELDMKRFLRPGYHGPWWTLEALALLGAVPDAEVARRTSRTGNAVRLKRERLGIARPQEPSTRSGATGRTAPAPAQAGRRGGAGPAEQAIRPLAIGPKNWLHLGGDGALYPSAVLLSVAASVKRHGLDPWAYLKRVLTELPARSPGTGLSDLLPELWARPQAGPTAVHG